MVTLDQVLALQEKVEGAVAKISRLESENKSLRARCDDLAGQLASKAEQLSSFENDQNKIESGLLKALDRLNAIENAALQAAPQAQRRQPEQPPQPRAQSAPRHAPPAPAQEAAPRQESAQEAAPRSAPVGARDESDAAREVPDAVGAPLESNDAQFDIF